jgi:hypothetical protein
MRADDVNSATEKLFKIYLKKTHANPFCLIRQISEKHGLNPDVIIGIYLIENNFRPVLGRMAEYTVLFGSWIFAKIFHKAVKNYTLGPFQTGITSILFYNNVRRCKIHDRLIKNLSFRELMFVYKCCKYKNNLCCCCKMVKSIESNLKTKWGDVDTNVGRIGEIYNGKILYGALLYELLSKIEQYN